MITYNYECRTCKHFLEVQQSIKDKPLKQCPACSQQSLERVIFGGIGFSIDKDPTTIGQQMERNSKKFGKNKVQELDAQQAKWKRDPHQEKVEKIINGGPDRINRYIRTGK